MPRAADTGLGPGRASRGDVLAALLASCARSGRMPGAAFRIAEAGLPIRLGAVGETGLDRPGERATADTVYDLASLTKPLATGLLLVLLEQEGRLALDSAAGLHLEELAGSTLASASLEALATHTSGLPAWEPLYLDGSSLEEYLRRIARLPFAGPPGIPLYSDLGYVVLGAVVERAAGERLDVLFRNRIAGPLGLERTGFARTGAELVEAAPTERGNEYERSLAGSRGAGYPWRKEIPRGQVHDGNCHALGGVAGHAGLFGSAEEVGRILDELLRPRSLALGERARRRMLVASVPDGSRSVGFVMAGHSSAARGILADDAPGHTGFTGTSIWLDPRSQRSYVLLTNRVHPAVSGKSFAVVRRGFHRTALRCAAIP